MEQDERTRRDEDASGDHEVVTRTRRSPRLGTKVTTLIALALLALGGYYLFAPVYMDTANGWFGCGNAAQGSSSDFVNNVCGDATQVNLARAILAGVLALIIGGLGAYFFGFDSSTEERLRPVERDEDDPPRDVEDDEPRARTSRRRRRDDDIDLRSYSDDESPRRGGARRLGRLDRDDAWSDDQGGERRPRRDRDAWDD